MVSQSQIGKKIIIFLLILTLAPMAGGFIYAAENPAPAENQYYLNISKETAAKGYEIKAFGGWFKLILPKGVLKDASGVQINRVDEAMDRPWQLDKLSGIFQYELLNKSAYDGAKSLLVEIKYDQASDYYKQIYFYDKNYSSWRPLICRELVKDNSVRCEIFFNFARLAVFANPEARVIGQASWYSYKKGDFAASPDFPKGSKSRVVNLANGKSVDVVVNDFGPDKRLYPDRPVDLDKVAFRKIASLSQGVIRVRVEPLKIAPSSGRLLGISGTGAKSEPSVSSKAAVVINEKTGEILWQKNATSTLPLASLTKLVAIKVFFDTRPSLNKIVTYRLADENYNYQYVKKWESARLNLKDGDRLTLADLLYAALVGSANNAIETLVRVSGLSRDDFIKTMNQAAADWGAAATRFVEPTGLAPANVSSALDYAIITKQLYANPLIEKASTMPVYAFTTLNTKKSHKIKNTDQLLAVSDLNITGSKTGFLDEAQYCLMARVKDKSGNQLIAVTLGTASRQASFDETEELLKYGLKAIKQQ